MPSYREHLLFGSLLVLVFSYLAGFLLSFTLEAVAVSAVLVLLASVFPDIDHEGSVVYRRTKDFTVLLVSLASLAYFYPSPVSMVLGGAVAGGLTALSFSWMKPRHRTVTHSFGAAVVFSAVAGLFSFLAFSSFLPALFVFVAYLSHLALDRVF